MPLFVPSASMCGNLSLNREAIYRPSSTLSPVVISSVTATKSREDQYGVIFSNGYHVSHQMLLSNGLKYDKDKSLCENLQKKRIGVVPGTTNEQAAKFLAQKCNCGIEVKTNYKELIESKSALFKGQVDLLQTDDIWLTGQSNLASFQQFGPTLDESLSEFYSSEYGRSHEEYAIVTAKNGGDELMEIVNDILNSEQTKHFIEAIEVAARGHPF
jgi:ABC-type amino acid transport substrate-binding protein